MRVRACVSLRLRALACVFLFVCVCRIARPGSPWKDLVACRAREAALGAEDGQCRIFYVDEPEPRDLARLSPRRQETGEPGERFLGF